MPDPEYLTTSQAAAIAGVTDETIRRWADTRKIRHSVLPSGQLRFTRADVEAAITVVERAAEPA